MAYKRKRKKTGDESYTTITTTDNGSKRVTHTHKSGQTTRSTSFSNKGSGVRRTTTYNPGNGGWINRKSYTNKPKTVRKSRSRKSADAGLGGIIILFGAFCLLLMYLFPSLIPFILLSVLVIAVIAVILNYLVFIFWGGLLILLLYFFAK